MVLSYDPDKCTGCRYCEIACAFSHLGVLDISKANLKVVFDEAKRAYEVAHCMHCDEPVCAAVCPTEAISKDETTGLVTLNRLRCVGCRSCVHVCPLGAPWFHVEEGVARKCDFCDGEPLCARYCSPKAMTVATREEARKRMEKRYGGGGHG